MTLLVHEHIMKHPRWVVLDTLVLVASTSREELSYTRGSFAALALDGAPLTGVDIMSSMLTCRSCHVRIAAHACGILMQEQPKDTQFRHEPVLSNRGWARSATVPTFQTGQNVMSRAQVH